MNSFTPMKIQQFYETTLKSSLFSTKKGQNNLFINYTTNRNIHPCINVKKKEMHFKSTSLYIMNPFFEDL